MKAYIGSWHYICFSIVCGMGLRAKLLQSCEVKLLSTLCDPMDCSLPGSSVHGILQARILEWVAMPYVSCIGRLILYH